MKRILLPVLLLAFVVGVPASRLLRAAASGTTPDENELVYANFFVSGDQLQDEQWTWLREDRNAWSGGKGELSLRASPGNLQEQTSTNVLLRPLPPSVHPLAIEVWVHDYLYGKPVTQYLSGKPMTRYGYAGLVWYADERNFVGVFQKNLEGKVNVQMVTCGNGKSHHDEVRCDAELLLLRLLISAGEITAQYRTDPHTPWITVGRSWLPRLGPARVGITAGGAAKNAEHSVDFRQFRIVEYPRSNPLP